MSLDTTRAVWRHSRAKGTTRLVLLCLADHTNDKSGLAWPRIDTIAAACGMSARTVQYALAELVKLGELEVVRSAGRTHANRYRVLVEKVQSAAPQRAETVQSAAPIQPEKVQRAASQKVQPAASLNHKEEPLELPPAAVAFDGALAGLAERGYVRDERFLILLARTYPDLNLELEALKLGEWLTEPRNRKRPCSKKFIDNWLRKAEADRVQREQLALTAIGPAAPKSSGGAVVNGVYHPPAAFQRNPNPEAELPHWDTEQARRSDAERERIKAELLARRRRVPA